MCDWTLQFKSLDELQHAVSNIEDYCLDIHATEVMVKMMDNALANYSNVNNGYDALFGYYVESVKKEVPQQLLYFMNATNRVGNQYFMNTDYDKVRKQNISTQPCPPDPNKLKNSRLSHYYTPVNNNASDFYAAILSAYRIYQSWVQLGSYTLHLDCPDEGPGCTRSTQLRGFPVAASSYTVPSPKDVVMAALPNIPTIQNTMTATLWDVYVGQWVGSQDDIAQIQATATFMLTQAVDNMQKVLYVFRILDTDMGIRLD